MSAIITITRRDFLRHSGVGAGALVLGCSITHPGPLSAKGIFPLFPFTLNPFVAIQLDGTIIIQAVVGSALAVLLTVKLWFTRVKLFVLHLFGRKRVSDDDPTE